MKKFRTSKQQSITKNNAKKLVPRPKLLDLIQDEKLLFVGTYNAKIPQGDEIRFDYSEKFLIAFLLPIRDRSETRSRLS